MSSGELRAVCSALAVTEYLEGTQVGFDGTKSNLSSSSVTYLAPEFLVNVTPAWFVLAV